MKNSWTVYCNDLFLRSRESEVSKGECVSIALEVGLLGTIRDQGVLLMVVRGGGLLEEVLVVEDTAIPLQTASAALVIWSSTFVTRLRRSGTVVAWEIASVTIAVLLAITLLRIPTTAEIRIISEEL